ncbi:hypothetical protein D3C81_1737600 [compost metagenome]
MNHFLCQFDNLYRLTHVKDEYFAALPHGACLNHQLRRFGDGHEVTSDLGVGNCQRPARFDLAVEQWNDRTGRPQHIAKTNHGEAGLVDARDIRAITKQNGSDFPTQGLQRQFGQPFSAAHHISGANSLVGRDQHEVGNSGLQRSLGGVERTNDIV